MTQQMSRRSFNKTSAAIAATAATGTVNAKDADAGWIDAHVHVWTKDLDAYPLGENYSREDMQPPNFPPEELFSHCKPVGVSRIVLIQMSYYRFDNSYMTDMMARHKGVFGGVAVIDENDSPRKAMMKMKRLGCRGFRIRPGDVSPDKWLDTPGMHEMWRTGAREGLAMCHLIDAKHLDSVDAMCRKYPDTPVVIDHFARIGVDGQIRKEDVDNLCKIAKHKNATVKLSAYYALGKKAAPYTDLIPMIRRCLDAYGPERCMWASDGPFQVVGGHQYAPSIKLITEHAEFLSDSDRQWILRKTAERVFFN